MTRATKKEPKAPGRHAIRLLEAGTEIHLSPSAGEPTFMARQLVQCTLPHRNPGQSPVWKRTSGDLTLKIQPYYDDQTTKYLYPYGTIPRLVLFWITTEALRTKKRRLILGDTLADFMRDLGLDPQRGGPRSDRWRLQDQLNRLLRARISFEHIRQVEQGTGVRWRDMQIGEEAQLWWLPHQQDHQPALFESYIDLTERFYEAIISAPVPIDMRALHALRNSPLALDLYAWSTYRTYAAQKKGEPITVTWAQLARQFGTEYGDLRNFQQKAKGALQKIQAVYPGLELNFIHGGLQIGVGRPAIAAR